MKYNGQVIWTLPKPELRQLIRSKDFRPSFMTADAGRIYFVISNAAPAGQDVLYAALGQYGVLVGPMPPQSSARPWHLAYSDFAELPPDPFRVTDLGTVVLAVVFFLAIPPFPWIQAWLLAQAWRYMFPIDQQQRAVRLAWLVSAGLTALTALALAYSLADSGADFAVTVGAVMAVTVVTCTLVVVRMARHRQFTNAFVWKMAIGTALLSAGRSTEPACGWDRSTGQHNCRVGRHQSHFAFRGTGLAGHFSADLWLYHLPPHVESAPGSA